MSETETSRWLKDPAARLDWSWSWVKWLATGETLDTYTVTGVPAGLTIDAPTEADGVVTAFISGGTRGVTYIVDCHVETNEGRIDERSLIIEVADR